MGGALFLRKVDPKYAQADSSFLGQGWEWARWILNSIEFFRRLQNNR